MHPKPPLPYRIAARTPNLHSLAESLRAAKISTPSSNRCSPKIFTPLPDRCVHSRREHPKSLLPHRTAARTQNLHSVTESLHATKISTPSPNRCAHPKSSILYQFAARFQNLHSISKSLGAPKLSTTLPNHRAQPKSSLPHRIVERIQNLHSH